MPTVSGAAAIARREGGDTAKLLRCSRVLRCVPEVLSRCRMVRVQVIPS